MPGAVRLVLASHCDLRVTTADPKPPGSSGVGALANVAFGRGDQGDGQV